MSFTSAAVLQGAMNMFLDVVCVCKLKETILRTLLKNTVSENLLLIAIH
jgi:hypothetical protein